ncbi:hypothetical protein QP844_08870 [Streptococcus xiaochunlingii]|uniref:hypothetical protein n=1 Tax=Streptococcus xiaochunlingii TaxID=2589788 RepID=UPI002552F50B|nr:hypothetical protein [Streptococcus xiaochunlingii]MDK8387238.1 hypothetical protein [Streptococcus xiaochunlingii]MDK8778970.1 hypothetical protein [Streptococcus xiaochunlingii]
MEVFVAKLNVEPTVLDLYEETNLLETVIPTSLNMIFDRLDEDKGIIGYRITNDIESIKKSKLYQEILQYRENLISEYYKVVAIFEDSGEIVYSKAYMSLRSMLKAKIDELFVTFPFLKNSEEIKVSSFSKGKISEIQMGITYIDRVNRIEKFLFYNSKDIRVINFYYDTSCEWIYIPVSMLITDDIVNELNSIVSEIEDKINNFKNITDIGNVSVNLVYDDFKIKPGKYKEIIVTKVYPNGHPALDRGKALRAARIETKYKAAQGETFSELEIEDETKVDAEKGYLSSIFARGKNLIENTILRRNIRED